MDEGLAAILGAIVGGAMSSGTLGLSAWIRERWKRKNLAIAIGAEVSAILEMVRRRQWLDRLSQFALEAQKENVYRFVVLLPDEFLIVSRSAMKDAGNLPGQLPGMVARVVMLADGIASDLVRLARYPIDHPDGFLFQNAPASAYAAYAELVGVLLDALRTCDLVVAEVLKLYPKAPIQVIAPTEVEIRMRQK